MLRLDLASDSSVSDCVSEVLHRAGRIDVLVNNAGETFNGSLEEMSIEEARAYFDSNFFGHVRMTDAVLPHMRAQKAGRIINMASVAGILPIPFEGFYSSAKAALIAYSDQLRQEVTSLGIAVSVVEPGFYKTPIGHAGLHSARSIGDYADMQGRVLKVLADSIAGGGNPVEVAETVLKIIKSSSPKLHYAVGKEKRYITLRKVVPASLFESQLRKQWRLDQ